MKSAFAICFLSVASGCATVTHDSMQLIRVDTKLPDGTTANGADCKLTNDHGMFIGKSGDPISVHRSGEDLKITCTSATQADATGKAVSRANAGMFGNILIGGGIGAVFDHVHGTAYTYPSWIDLTYGKTLVFDRSDEKDGQPLAGKETGTDGSPAPQAGTAASPASGISDHAAAEASAR